MEVWSKFRKIFGSKAPQAQTIPNLLYSYFNQQKNNKWKSVLPKNPDIVQIRNFAKNPIVRRPITLIEDYVTRLPHRIVPKDPNDKKAYKKQIDIANRVIANPNTIQKKRQFDRMVLEDLLTFDAGCTEKAKSKDVKRPLYLYPTDGATMQYIVPYDYNDDNALRYSQVQPNLHEPKYFTANQIAYLQKNVFSDRPYGLSPVMQAYQYIVYYINILERADDVASNMTSEFMIWLKGAGETEGKKFREYMENEIQGTGTIPIGYSAAGSDVESKQIRSINGDSLFLDWQRMLMMVVGMSFNCPQEKMNVIPPAEKLTGTDIEALALKEMYKPYADIMSDFYNEEVLATLGYDDFLKYEYIYEDSIADVQALSTTVGNLYQSDIITRKQAQSRLNMVDESDTDSNKYVSEYKNELNMKLQKSQAENSATTKGVGGFNGQGTVKDTSEANKAPVNKE